MNNSAEQSSSQKPLEIAFDSILASSAGQPISMRQICKLLANKGYAVILVILSFPVCFPITMPGICEPIGLIMAFLGLRIAFRKDMWWPEWILAKQVPYNWLKTVIEKARVVFKALQKVMRPRLSFLVTNPILQQFHGLLICVLSLLLALPLPIPLTNTFAALPIFFLALGLLEDDGAVIIVSYILSLVCFIAFGMLFWLGEAGLRWLWIWI